MKNPILLLLSLSILAYAFPPLWLGIGAVLPCGMEPTVVPAGLRSGEWTLCEKLKDCYDLMRIIKRTDASQKK